MLHLTRCLFHIHTAGSGSSYFHSTNDGTGATASDGIVMGMGAAADAVAVSDANATIVTTLHHLESLLVDPGTNAVTVEVFIAC